MNHSPLVSIIIPYYNSSKYFKELLESIDSQTIKDIELIIIDDKSEPVEQQKLKEIIVLFPNLPKTVLYNSKNQGVAKTRNLGLQMATGKYLIFIDADDLLCGKYSLEYRIHFLEKQQNFAGVAGYPLMIDGEGKLLFTVPDKKIPFFQKAVTQPANLLRIYCENIVTNTVESASTLFFCTGSSLFRRDEIIHFPFDASYDLEDDVEWLIRFLKEKSMKLEMIPFHCRRVHEKQYHLVTPSQTTKKVVELAKDVLKEFTV